MNMQTTVTHSDNEEHHSKHDAVQDNTLIQCPGCGKTKIPIRTTFGVMFTKQHKIPSRFPEVSNLCDYSEEILKPFLTLKKVAQ